MLPWSPSRSLEFFIIPPSRLLFRLHKLTAFQPNRAICWASWWQGSPFLGAVNFFGPLTFSLLCFYNAWFFPRYPDKLWHYWINQENYPSYHIFAFEPESSDLALLEEIAGPMPGMKRFEFSAHLKLGSVTVYTDFKDIWFWCLTWSALWEAYHYNF